MISYIPPFCYVISVCLPVKLLDSTFFLNYFTPTRTQGVTTDNQTLFSRVNNKKNKNYKDRRSKLAGKTEAGRYFHNQEGKSQALVSKFLVIGIQQYITNKIVVTFEPVYTYFLHVLHYCQTLQMQIGVYKNNLTMVSNNFLITCTF